MNEPSTARTASSLRALTSHRVVDLLGTHQGGANAPLLVGNISVGRACPTVRMCGQRALAFASAQSLDAVVNAVGHCGPMTVREIRAFFERYADLRPTELSREALGERPAAIWWAFGARRFLAVLVQFYVDRLDRMGHAFVLEGYTLFDPDFTGGDAKQRVRPDVLCQFDYAFVLSARERGI